MNVLSQVWTLLRFSLKRLWVERGLALASVVGLTVSVALVMSIPLYADATQFRILREQINGAPDDPGDAPLSFFFRYEGPAVNGPQWPDARAADEYISGAAAQAIGLPQVSVARIFRGDGFKLFPPPDPNDTRTQYLLTWINFTYLHEPEKYARLVDGAFASPDNVTAEGPVEIVVNESIATEYGIATGDNYVARRDDGTAVPVRVAGIWAPRDARAPYWDNRQPQMALVAEPAYLHRISPIVEDELQSVSWLLVVDGSRLHAADVPPLLDNIQQMTQQAESLLPGLTLKRSQIAELQQYRDEAPTLTLLLYAFSLPILGLILAFIGLVAGLFVHQQRNEIAILRSRGASVAQVTGIAALQGLVLGVLALAVGLPGGIALTHLIGRARSFLDFTAPGGLRVSVTLQDLLFGILAIGLVLLVLTIGPTLGAARHTIVTYKQERARAVQGAWWQRAWLDVLLLLPAFYGAYILNQQGSLAAGQQAALPDPLRNPILLLAPALGIFAVTLFVLRIIPALMSAVAGLSARTNSVGILMAARYLSRTPAFYNAPMALLVLTLSLSAFTASLALTLDRHLYRQTYYETGSDMRITELGTTVNAKDSASPTWTFRPLEEHFTIPGVRAATRVGRYSASILQQSGGQVSGVFLGIDRLSLPQVAFWQHNFAPESLGALMNSLGAAPEGVLVSREYLESEGLALGDTVTLGVNPGQPVGLTATIVGVVDLFPTWYPEDGPLIVGNLDQLFSLMGTEYIHEVWLRTDSSADPEYVVRAIRGFSILLDPAMTREDVVENGLNTQVEAWESAALIVTAEQRRPERQGLFGLLSVGFAASALLTVLGFLLYALFSFRRRFIEMGMLRAIGLSAGQMRALLASELNFLILIGLAVGTVLGITVSRWFIPYLQIGTATTAHYPPFIVELAWPAILQIYVLFGLLFLGAFAGLAALLLRMKIFQAVKLGETA